MLSMMTILSGLADQMAGQSIYERKYRGSTRPFYVVIDDTVCLRQVDGRPQSMQLNQFD